MNPTIELIIGMAGMLLLLFGFLFSVLRHASTNDAHILWMNLVGSILLGWYAYLLGSAPFLILNILWLAVSSWGMLHYQKHRQLRR